MKGARRVITFFLMIAVVPVILLAIPLYLRHQLYKDITYEVSESDILEMVNGFSSIFCQEHSLKMDAPFSAFQVESQAEMSSHKRKHVHLKKSMTLPDDTLEYWGFYLPKGSTVFLSVCSRYDGSRILVVKGDRELRDCGLSKPEEGFPTQVSTDGGVVVTYESGVFRTEVKQPEGEQENHGGEDMQEGSGETGTVDRKQKLMDRLTIAKRSPGERFLDAGITHGVDLPQNERVNDSSASSFETSLLTCHEGYILHTQGFAPSIHCTSPDYLLSSARLSANYTITSDGYYYYIFYSDNDFFRNEIHAVFDIHKPTFLFNNYSLACINVTECTFPVSFWSDEIVIIEVPTRDGIDRESEDNHILVSTCHPRTLMYAIFPISVLFLILLCAFI